MARIRLMVSSCDVLDHVLVELQELQPQYSKTKPTKPVWKRLDAQIRTLEQATSMLNQQAKLEEKRAAAFHAAVAEAGSAFRVSPSFSGAASAMALIRGNHPDADAVHELLEGAE